jgi:hypothetical protein
LLGPSQVLNTARKTVSSRPMWQRVSCTSSCSRWLMTILMAAKELVPGVGVELEALCRPPSPQPTSRCNRGRRQSEMVPGVGVEQTSKFLSPVFTRRCNCKRAPIGTHRYTSTSCSAHCADHRMNTGDLLGLPRMREATDHAKLLHGITRTNSSYHHR